MAKAKKCRNCARVVFANDGTPMCNKAIGAVLNLEVEACGYFESCTVRLDCVHYRGPKKCHALNGVYYMNEKCSYYKKK